jgi:regulator of protease activity HflC (stomatin/prohibitin superfamily)
MSEKLSIILLSLGSLFLAVLLFIVLPMWVYPKYRVYAQEMYGKAKYAEAESSRQITVLEAKAKLESSKSLALAEVERAKGVAEANKIIGQSLNENEAYLRYLYIQALQDNQNNVIYVPTEAGLPILEAGKRGGK